MHNTIYCTESDELSWFHELRMSNAVPMSRGGIPNA